MPTFTTLTKVLIQKREPAKSIVTRKVTTKKHSTKDSSAQESMFTIRCRYVWVWLNRIGMHQQSLVGSTNTIHTHA